VKDLDGDGDVDKDDVAAAAKRPKVKKFKKFNCKTFTVGRSLIKSISINVTAQTLLNFEVKPTGLKSIKGESTQVRFTAMPTTTYVPPTTEFQQFTDDGISGVLIFSIVTGALVVIVLLAFLVAYFCKWQIVQEDPNIMELANSEDDIPETKTLKDQYDGYKV